MSKQVKVKVIDRWRVVYRRQPSSKATALTVPENIIQVIGNAGGSSDASSARAN